MICTGVDVDGSLAMTYILALYYNSQLQLSLAGIILDMGSANERRRYIVT